MHFSPDARRLFLAGPFWSLFPFQNAFTCFSERFLRQFFSFLTTTSRVLFCAPDFFHTRRCLWRPLQSLPPPPPYHPLPHHSGPTSCYTQPRSPVRPQSNKPTPLLRVLCSRGSGAPRFSSRSELAIGLRVWPFCRITRTACFVMGLTASFVAVCCDGFLGRGSLAVGFLVPMYPFFFPLRFSFCPFRSSGSFCLRMLFWFPLVLSPYLRVSVRFFPFVLCLYSSLFFPLLALSCCKFRVSSSPCSPLCFLSVHASPHLCFPSSVWFFILSLSPCHPLLLSSSRHPPANHPPWTLLFTLFHPPFIRPPTPLSRQCRTAGYPHRANTPRSPIAHTALARLSLANTPLAPRETRTHHPNPKTTHTPLPLRA